MMNGVLRVVLCVLSLCLPLAAQDASSTFALYQPEIFSTVDSLTLIHRLPILSFLDGTRLPVSSELGRMGRAPVDLPSFAYIQDVQLSEITVSRANQSDGKDFVSDGKGFPGDLDATRLDPIRYGGEVGFLYGHGSGKYGGDTMQTYMLGDVGNDKFQISVGAAYQESNGRITRWSR